MKKLFFLAIICAIISCKKEDTGISRSQVAGTWELESTEGTLSGTSNYPPGNGSIIFITKSGNFQRRQHDSVTYSGTYNLQNKKDCFESEFKTVFATSDGGELYIGIKEEKLSLSAGNCIADGGTSYYRRLP